jgi:hypothetical protein
MRNMTNSLVEAMGRMLDERLPAARRRAPHHRDESGDDNSGYGHGFRDHFQGGRGGGRRAGHEHRRAGGDRDHDRRVRFDDEDESHGSHEEEYNDDENPFAHRGPFERHRERRCAAGHDGDNRHGHNRVDPDSIAHVKLSVPKFSGKEDVDAYLDWEEQCDQILRVHNLFDRRHVSLASIELYGFALIWWNQIQENQLVLGRDHINTWAAMKRVMRRRFIHQAIVMTSVTGYKH